MNTWMLREATYHQLVINHGKQAKVRGTDREIDFAPVCLLRIPLTDMFWMLTELDPLDEIAFGLCQIQMAEMGSVWMPELVDLDVQGLKVIEDVKWTAKMTLGQYARKSRENGWMLSL